VHRARREKPRPRCLRRDDHVQRSALSSVDRHRAGIAQQAGERSGTGRSSHCPARALRGAAARIFVLGARTGPYCRRRGRCCIRRRGVGRAAPGAAGLDQGPVCRRRIPLLRRIEPAPAGGSLGAGRAAGGDAAAPARCDHGQDPHGQIRVWRHRAEQPPRGTVQPVGRRCAPLGRRLVERRRCQPSGRLGPARVRQRYGGLGAYPGLNDRQCGAEGHDRALVHQRHRAAVFYVRHARTAGAQRLRSRLRLCRARSRRHRSIQIGRSGRHARSERNSHRYRRGVSLARLRSRDC
jgi:hypothetical protein